jgi:hypothetical protein
MRRLAVAAGLALALAGTPAAHAGMPTWEEIEKVQEGCRKVGGDFGLCMKRSMRQMYVAGGTSEYDSTLNGKVLDLAIREAVNRLRADFAWTCHYPELSQSRPYRIEALPNGDHP